MAVLAGIEHAVAVDVGLNLVEPGRYEYGCFLDQALDKVEVVEGLVDLFHVAAGLVDGLPAPGALAVLDHGLGLLHVPVKVADLKSVAAIEFNIACIRETLIAEDNGCECLVLRLALSAGLWTSLAAQANAFVAAL